VQSVHAPELQQSVQPAPTGRLRVAGAASRPPLWPSETQQRWRGGTVVPALLPARGRAGWGVQWPCRSADAFDV